jgi:hypothetical protein
MKERNLSRRKMTTMMRISRSQVDRVVQPNNGDVTLETLKRAGGNFWTEGAGRAALRWKFAGDRGWRSPQAPSLRP